MTKQVLCVGAAVLDTIFRVRTLPTGEGKVLPYDMVQIPEGMASSAAYAVVRLGGAATLWGAVGDDETGDRIRQGLAADGIDTDGMRIAPGAPSALSTILVDDHGDRLIIPFYDHRLHAEPPRVTEDDLARFDAVLVDVRWPALARQVLRAAAGRGIPAILDGDVAPVDTLRDLAAFATHIIFSEPAARSLSTERNEAALVRDLAEQFGTALVSVTFGERGSYWLEPEGRTLCHQPALAIEAIDTLAAGDAFHGAFALGLAEEMSVADAIRLGSVTAALKCTVFGGRRGMPLRADAQAALRRLSPVQTGL